ncbi:MAG: 30S ribosomal protein S2 [Candidatus Aenigmatarchaeota archaeon]
MPFENYLSAGMHIGMKQQTKDMKKFIYKVRSDGLAVLNVSMIDERIKIAARMLAKHDRIIVVSRKAMGKKPAVKFAEVTGAKAITGRFLPGTITNPAFKGYFEPSIIIATDPLIDKQAITEAARMRLPIIALCDTFNETSLVDLVIPCNNKGRKALAMVFWTLAKEYLKAKGMIKSDEEFTVKPEEFESEETIAEERGEERPRRPGMRGGPRMGGRMGGGRPMRR